MNPSPDTLSRRDFLRLASTGAAGVAAGLPLLSLADGAAPGRRLGVALVGLGSYSEHQLAPALARTRLCRLAGLVSGDPAKAAAWARKWSVPARSVYRYEDIDRIADNPDVDIVYVVTPPALHRDFVVRAAKAGKHVISEKPLAPTVADCDAMIAACKAARVRFSVGYRLHFDPYHREMMRQARSGELGGFDDMASEHSFRLRFDNWRSKRALGGGGPMMDMGIYVIQGALMAQNEVMPVAVTAYEEPKQDPVRFADVEESMRFTLEFPNKAVMRGGSNYDRSEDRLWLRARKGWMDFPASAYAYQVKYCATSRGAISFPTPPYPYQQAAQMDDFADCILTGRETPVPGEMGRRDIRIVQAIYEAARTGKRVAL